MTDRRALPVPDGLGGLRLDLAVSRLFGLSRATAAALVSAGQVLVDGAARGRADRLPAGAWLEVALPEPPPARPPEPVAGLRVLHRDDDLLVLDKPAGVAAHPSPGWQGPTVTGALQAAGLRVAGVGAAERQGVVHRLDVGTSGLMAVAVSDRAYSGLKRAFRDRLVHKRYAALVQGHPDAEGTVDAPIDRHPRHRGRFAVVAGGRPSVTHFDAVEGFRAATLLDVRLETGRTHQIRVHLAALRHPCVGDLPYGADPALATRLGLHRQWLHATRLCFPHPADGRPVSFTSEPADDLAAALQVLRREA